MRKLLLAVFFFIISAAVLLFIISASDMYELNPLTVEMPALSRLQSVNIERDGDDTVLKGNDPRVIPEALPKLYSVLSELMHFDTVDTVRKAKYGLKNPLIRVSYAFRGGEHVTVDFGNLNTYLSKRYVALDTDRVVLAPEEYLTLFTESSTSFIRKKVFLMPIDSIRRVSITNKSLQHTVEIVGGTPAGWLVNNKQADPVFLGGFLKDLSEISYERLIDKNEQQMKASGLFAPQATIHVNWQAEDGAERITALYIGNAIEEEKKRIGYFAFCDNADKIMVLAPYAFRRLVVREENLTKP